MPFGGVDANQVRSRTGKRLAGIVEDCLRLSNEPRAGRFLLAALVVLLLVVPAVLRSQYWLRVLALGGVMVMMALGLNVIAGYTGLLNLGYAGFYAVGAYTYALLASPLHNIHMPFVLVLPLAGVLAAILGGALALPVMSLKGDFLALVTLAFGEIIRILLNNLVPLTAGSQGIMNIDHPRILSFTVTTPRDYYYLVLVLCAAEVFFLGRLARSKTGRLWTAIREDEGAARGMGVNSDRQKLLACIIGTIPAGLAGVIFAAMQTFVSPPSFTSAESIAVLCMVIVGGCGHMPGVILGAMLLGILPEPLRQYTENYRMFIYGAILVLFVVFRPEGIWPVRYRRPHGIKEETALSEGENTGKAGVLTV